MNVNFRIAVPTDAADMLSIYAPFCEATYVSFEIVPPSAAEMRGRIVRILPNYPWLVGEIDGKLTGYVYAAQHRERAGYRWAVDVAVYIAAEHRRKGLGRALYSTLFEILRLQGYVKAIAGITLPNEHSIGLHEALGFRPVGVFQGVGYKLGRWLDVGWWQLDLRPPPANPPEPTPFREIRDDPAVIAAIAAGERQLQIAV
jgi:L-amino acid N-acyltransferase YncA